MPDNRDYQAPIQSHSNAYVDILLVNDLVPPHRGIHYRPFLYAFDHGLDDKRHEGESDSVALCKLRLEFVSEFRRLSKVDLHEAGYVRRDVTALNHPLCDPPAHHRHWLDFVTVTFGERRRSDFIRVHGRRCQRLRRPSGGRLGSRRFSCRRDRASCWWRRGFPLSASILDEAQYVVLGHAAGQPRALDLRYVNAVLGG